MLRNGPGGEESLRSLLRQTLQALHTLHSHNITHRYALQAPLPLKVLPDSRCRRHPCSEAFDRSQVTEILA